LSVNQSGVIENLIINLNKQMAFVFALHTFRPTPIYVMDEIDAALDFKNVSIVGRFIKERTKNVSVTKIVSVF